MNEIWRGTLAREAAAAKKWDERYGFLIDYYDERAAILNPDRPEKFSTTRASYANRANSATPKAPVETPQYLCNHFHTMRREITRETLKNSSLTFITTNSGYGAAVKNNLEVFPREHIHPKTDLK